jgi:hypothetical protein
VGDRGHAPEGSIARARQPFRAPHQGTQDRGGTGGGRGVHGPDFFAKVPSYIPEDTKTGLYTPRANRYHSSYLR